MREILLCLVGVAGLWGAIAEVNGTRLYYEVQGAGRPVVLVHGGLLDGRMWDDQVPVLAKKYRVIRYDVRGFGRSAEPVGPYLAADDLTALLDQLKIPKATLVGLSLGGRISIDFALLHPERVEALVLLAPGLSGFQGLGDGGKSFWERVAAARTEGPKKAVELWLKDPIMAPAMENPAVAAKIRPIAEANQHVFLQNPLFEMELKPPAIERLGAIRCPTLLLIGDRDVRAIEAIAGILDIHVPNLRKVVIRGSGHMLNMEKPEEVNRLVLEFLK